MFINCIAGVKADLKRQEELLQRANDKLKELKQYDGFYLSSSRGRYFYKTTTENKRRVRTYIGTRDCKAVKEMKEYQLLTALVKEHAHNIKVLNHLLADYHEISRESLLNNVGIQFQSDESLAGALVGEKDPIVWKQRAEALKAKYTPPHPEGLKHRTIDGTLARTKSEATYYNELLLRGYIFVYELPLRVNGIVRFPDFTIFNPDNGELIIIEHFGYMGGSEEYAKDAATKIRDYIMDGWVPGENFLMFFETLDGAIDTEYIFREIERVLSKG